MMLLFLLQPPLSPLLKGGKEGGHKRDANLLKRIALTLGCGIVKSDSNDMRYLAVRNKEELQTKIVPFFSLYLLHSGKHQDFLHFKSAVSIQTFFF
jgi:hypothetical protein